MHCVFGSFSFFRVFPGFPICSWGFVFPKCVVLLLYGSHLILFPFPLYCWIKECCSPLGRDSHESNPPGMFPQNHEMYYSAVWCVATLIIAGYRIIQVANKLYSLSFITQQIEEFAKDKLFSVVSCISSERGGAETLSKDCVKVLVRAWKQIIFWIRNIWSQLFFSAGEWWGHGFVLRSNLSNRSPTLLVTLFCTMYQGLVIFAPFFY